jgi:tRNA(Arg) A34 adenosine deaminase TadA
LLLGAGLPRVTTATASAIPEAQRRQFAARAWALRAEALRVGDQPYGAVVVCGGTIVGEGVSAVLRRADTNAHAERLAMADALARLGTPDLAGCVLFGSARACPRCEAEATRVRIAAMYFGEDATPAGAPSSRATL